jgi:plastocyanin
MTMTKLRRLGLPLAVAATMISQIAAARCEEAVISIDNFTFAPAQLTVKVGTTVRWTNHDDIPHQVVAAGTFKSTVLDSDDSYAFTFTTAGDYAYFCSLHPHMTGMIKVE